MKGWIIGLAIAGVIAWVGYEDSKEEVRDQAAAGNAAANGATATTYGGSGSDSVLNLRTGDCISDGERDVYQTVNKVSCASPKATAKVIYSFAVSRASYPFEAWFDDQANEHCPATTDNYMFPTEDTWGLGDRTINCMMAM